MRAGKLDLVLPAALLPLGLFLAGCKKEVKADFPRPPATVSMAPAVEDPEPAGETERVPPETEAVDALSEPPAAETTPEPPEPSRRAPRSRTSPPADPKPESPPPSTQLAGTGSGAGSGSGGASGSGGVSPGSDVISKLQRASSLLSSMGGRNLSSPQKDQLTAARRFVAQARTALADGDERRALVLIDKGLILAEDVERTSRP